MVGCVLTALGCLADNAPLVILGFVGVGAMNGSVLLARTAAADMYPPEKKARAISYVLFGALFGAALGPLVFRPLFAGKDLELDTLVIPWFVAAAMCARRARHRALDPARSANDRARAPARLGWQKASPSRATPAAPLGQILRRPGVPSARDRRARELRGDGGRDEPDRVHRRRATTTRRPTSSPSSASTSSGCTRSSSSSEQLVDRVGTAAVADRRARDHGRVDGDARLGRSRSPGCRVSLFLLGLGWNLSYVAATAELVDLRHSGRARSPRRVHGSRAQV